MARRQRPASHGPNDDARDALAPGSGRVPDPAPDGAYVIVLPVMDPDSMAAFRRAGADAAVAFGSHRAALDAAFEHSTAGFAAAFQQVGVVGLGGVGAHIAAAFGDLGVDKHVLADGDRPVFPPIGAEFTRLFANSVMETAMIGQRNALAHRAFIEGHSAGPPDRMLVVPLPADRSAELLGLVAQVCRGVASGRHVKVVVGDDEDADLTSQQVADLLNVSRPHVVKLAKTGELPSHKVGTHHRFKAADVDRYLVAMRARRDEALQALAAEGYQDGDF